MDSLFNIYSLFSLSELCKQKLFSSSKHPCFFDVNLKKHDCNYSLLPFFSQLWLLFSQLSLENEDLRLRIILFRLFWLIARTPRLFVFSWGNEMKFLWLLCRKKLIYLLFPPDRFFLIIVIRCTCLAIKQVIVYRLFCFCLHDWQLLQAVPIFKNNNEETRFFAYLETWNTN